MTKNLKTKNLSGKRNKGKKKGSIRHIYGNGAALHCESVNTLSDKDNHTKHAHTRRTHAQTRASTYTILEEAGYSWQTESVSGTQLRFSMASYIEG